MPSSRRIEGVQFISYLISVLSLLRPRTPLGASRLWDRLSVTPAISSTMSTRRLIVTSSSLPMFNGSRAFPSSRPNDAEIIGRRLATAPIRRRSATARGERFQENRWSRQKTLPSVASLCQ
jgi:hypothetical protein